MSRTTLAVLVILTVALAAWAGDTGLGTSPFTSGDQLTATAVNAMNDAINDKYVLTPERMGRRLQTF
jgi:hypothetical protein